MAVYVPKHDKVNAIQWTGQNVDEVLSFCEGHAVHNIGGNAILIGLFGGAALVGDYIIKYPPKFLGDSSKFNVWYQYDFEEMWTPEEK